MQSLDDETEQGCPSTTPLPVATGSILQFVNTNFTPGSSIADVDSVEAGTRTHSSQLRREEYNIALRRISSELIPMEQTHPTASTSHNAGSGQEGSRSSLSGVHEQNTQASPKTCLHQPKPSVSEEVEANFFQVADAQLNGQARGRVDPSTARAGLASMPCAPTQENRQARVESYRTGSNRAWADFSESEFDGDSRRELVQVAPGEWQLESRSSDTLADQAIPDYQPLHPSQIIPEELYPQDHVLAGNMAIRNFNANPANNALWQAQYSHPAIRNLSAAVQHASTDMHALVLENQVLRHDAAVNAHRIRGLERELERVTDLLRVANLGTRKKEGEGGDHAEGCTSQMQSETSNQCPSGTSTGKEADVDEEGPPMT